jgi:outer membrane protein TolC
MAAKSWFLAAELSLLARMTDSLTQASTDLFNLVEARRRVGNSNDQDVALARADLGVYRDRSLQLEQDQQEARRALEVLAGRYPKAALGLPDSFPGSLPPVPAGLPVSLLERRPDLYAANLRVASAYYARRQAVVARLPALSLTGSFGAVSSEVLQLQQDFSNPVASIGANLLAPIFHGGALKAQVEIQTALQRAAVAAYGGAVLGALKDVENALGAEQILRQREAILVQVVGDNKRAVAVSQARYAVGQEDLRPGLQQRQRLFSAETDLIRVRAERIIQRINLHLALGGGFVLPPVDSVKSGR